MAATHIVERNSLLMTCSGDMQRLGRASKATLEYLACSCIDGFFNRVESSNRMSHNHSYRYVAARLRIGPGTLLLGMPAGLGLSALARQRPNNTPALTYYYQGSVYQLHGILRLLWSVEFA